MEPALSSLLRRHSHSILPKAGAALLIDMAAIDYDMPLSEPLYLRAGRLDLRTRPGGKKQNGKLPGTIPM